MWQHLNLLGGTVDFNPALLGLCRLPEIFAYTKIVLAGAISFSSNQANSQPFNG
jgi:hypothetical protein